MMQSLPCYTRCAWLSTDRSMATVLLPGRLQAPAGLLSKAVCGQVAAGWEIDCQEKQGVLITSCWLWRAKTLFRKMAAVSAEDARNKRIRS